MPRQAPVPGGQERWEDDLEAFFLGLLVLQDAKETVLGF